MKEQTMRLIDLAINHLEQMGVINESITKDSLKRFVTAQIWTKPEVYHNVHYINAIAHIAWNSTTTGKREDTNV